MAARTGKPWFRVSGAEWGQTFQAVISARRAPRRSGRGCPEDGEVRENGTRRERPWWSGHRGPARLRERHGRHARRHPNATERAVDLPCVYDGRRLRRGLLRRRPAHDARRLRLGADSAAGRPDWQSHPGRDAGGGDGRGAAHRPRRSSAAGAGQRHHLLAGDGPVCDRARRDAVRDRPVAGRVRGRRGRAIDHRAGVRVFRAAPAQRAYRGGLRRNRHRGRGFGGRGCNGGPGVRVPRGVPAGRSGCAGDPAAGRGLPARVARLPACRGARGRRPAAGPRASASTPTPDRRQSRRAPRWPEGSPPCSPVDAP